MGTITTKSAAPARLWWVVVLSAALTSGSVEVPAVNSTDLTVGGRRSATPSIASLGEFVAVAWGATAKDGTTDVYIAVSRDAGKTFGRPARANDDRTRASLSGEQPPRVSLSARARRDPSIVVVWTTKESTATRLVSAKSDDGGMSFGRPALVPGTDAPGNRGWEAITTDRSGNVVAIWLDHRDYLSGQHGTAAGKHTEHAHASHGAGKSDGAARAQLSKLFFGRLDSAASVRPITGGVCYCCKTTIATVRNGAIYAAWRHVYAGNIRDIAFSASRDEGRSFSPPVRVSEDKWILDGCPENGPAMAVDASGRIHIAWPTLVSAPSSGSEPALALFYATSTDGQRFSPRERIHTEGTPRHPYIAVDADGTMALTWDEQVKARRRVAVATRLPPSGGRSASPAPPIRFSRQQINDTAPGSYPVVAAVKGGFVVAWTRGDVGETVIRTQRIR
jgi:hypothetical protein